MTLLSNWVRPSDLKPGDHIYTWRSCYAYTYHGIYVGNNEVIFFNGFMHNLQTRLLQKNEKHHKIGSDLTAAHNSSSVPLTIPAAAFPHSNSTSSQKSGCPSTEVPVAASSLSGFWGCSTGADPSNSLSAPAAPPGPAASAVPEIAGTLMASADTLAVSAVTSSVEGQPSAPMLSVHSTSSGSYPTAPTSHYSVPAEPPTCSQLDTARTPIQERNACDNAIDQSVVSDRGCVVKSTLAEFLLGGDLYRYEYGVTRVSKVVKLRGTCTRAHSDTAEAVLHRATYLLQHPSGFGPYDPLRNNSEDFALYCKTGLVFLPDPSSEGKNRGHAVGLMKKAAAAAIHGAIAAAHSMAVSEAVAQFVLRTSKEFIAKEGHHHAKNCSSASAAISTIAMVAHGVEHPLSIPFTLAKFLLEARGEYILKHGIDCFPSRDDTVHEPILPSDGVRSSSVPLGTETALEGSQMPVKGELIEHSLFASPVLTTFFKFALDRAKELLEASADGCNTVRSSEADAAISAINALQSSHTLFEAYIRYLIHKSNDFSQSEEVHPMDVETMVEILSAANHN